MAETRTNQIFVTDTPERLEAIAVLIKKLDISLRQVLIEARIVQADESFGRNLGVRWGGFFTRQTDTQKQALAGTIESANSASGFSAANTPSVNNNFINLPAAAINGYNPFSLAVSIFSPVVNRLLNLEISALEADGKGQMVSNPRIVTADKHKAVIEQGTELPYQLTGPNGSTSITFRKANLRLEVTPHITPSGDIVLNLDINKDSVGRATAAGFAIDTKHIQTQVVVENGGTISIGGIYEEGDGKSNTKVPLLGDIPILGGLFRATSFSKEKSELLIFVTPTLLFSQKSETGGAKTP